MILHMSPRAPRPAVLLALAAVAGQAQAPTRLTWPVGVDRVQPPAAAGSSGQPQLTTSHRGAILSWIERSDGRAVLKFAERTPSGWSAPRTVASGADWFVNWADVPSVMRLANGTLAAHWLQKSGPDTYAYDVRLSYSKDDGKTWSSSFTPHTDGTKTEHGFASLFQIPGSGLGLVWLDGRTPGEMSLRFASYDANWKQTAEEPIDPRVCECCPTTGAVTADGPIAAYRDRGTDDMRNIHVTRLEKGRWSESKAVHDDGWKINACPVNGPMLSARGRDVAIAWFTMNGQQGRAFVAFSKDAGRTFGAPVRLDDSAALGRVDVELLPDGSAVASWIEFADKQTQFRVRRVEPSGTSSPSITVAPLVGSRTSGYPRIAFHAGELVFAWVDAVEGRSQIQTAVARVPPATVK
jgi:hypothetical protein